MTGNETLLFVRLSDHAPLRWRAEACLPARYPDFDCPGCRESCPTHTLSIVDGQMVLGDACLGCGRCVAACPTAALAMPGLTLADVDVEGRGPIEVECWKVPAREIDRCTQQVPCLGALKASQLISMHNDAGGRPVHLVDRGWCKGCEAGCGTDFIAAPLVERVNALLDEMGVPEGEHVSVVARPLPEKQRPRAIPDPSTRRSLDRRSFFTGMAREMAAAAHEVRSLPASTGSDSITFDRHSKVWPAERVSLLAELSRLSKRTGAPVPVGLFPAIRVNADCENHGVCSALCPTGALVSYEAGTVSGLQFSTHLCIACGLCGTKCPERAIEFLSDGDGTGPKTVVNLTVFRERECFDCGRMFAGGRDDEERPDDELPVCPACRRSRGFASAAFKEFYAPRG